MKKIFIGTMLFINGVTTFSQQTNPSSNLTKQDYQLKAKHQEIAALCLGGAGFIVWAAGANKYMNQKDNVDGGGEAAMAVGGLSCLASIPLFIIASKNRKKARQIVFNNQQLPQLQINSFICHSIPSLTLKISL